MLQGQHIPPQGQPEQDLRVMLVISSAEAQKGTTRILRLPQDQQIEVIIPAGVYDGQIISLPFPPSPSAGQARFPTRALLLAITIKTMTDGFRETLIDVARDSVVKPGTLSANFSGWDASRSRMTGILLALLALFIIVPGIGFADLAYSASAAWEQNEATVIAVSQSVATAAAVTAIARRNPYPPGGGTLTLDDPLADNSQGHQWDAGANSDGACQFGNGGYQAQAIANNTYGCFDEVDDFSNFAYQAQMMIQSGEEGGIAFRSQSLSTHWAGYYFSVAYDGYYYLTLFSQDNATGTSKAQSLSSGYLPAAAYHVGSGPNLLAVIARGSSIDLYANHQHIITITDKTFTHGRVGLCSSLFQGEASPVSILFSDAKVWKL
jgi:hypothetical protein